MNSTRSDDIAIVGLACRYPGEARSPDGFLSMLKDGRAAWSKIPKDRFDIDKYHHPSHERQGNIIAQGGYFLKEDVGLFDAPFFSMTAAEANAMDPQQRLLLELTYEAFESAGIPMQRMIGTETSVYIGCFTRDYEAVSARQLDNTLLYQATGQGLAMLSNRLSWFYDLKGPSATLDTACSSSLLALHLACQSIRAGESNMSIVGGTGLVLLPDTMRVLTALHFLSPDSKCYSFDDRANGYARGEGVGTVILKPVTDAIRDGDTIRAVIRGTGSNQDGRTPGITLPSSEAQAKLIARTYREAGLPYHETQYFEAHGTGTPAGDPLELAALGATFGQDTSVRAQPLYVGSVKTNIGHLEGCAGLAGLMKAILSVESGYIFPSLNFENPNPRLRLREWNVKIATELSPWPTTGTRRVSINSFGYGGSNVHAIIDDAYHYLAERDLRGYTNTDPSLPVIRRPNETGLPGNCAHKIATQSPLALSLTMPANRKQIFVFSARDQASLGRLISSYAAYVAGKAQTQGQSTFLENLAYTLASRRSSFQWKHAAIGATIDEVSRALESAAVVRSKKQARLGLIFTGQGAQWFGMGRQLMEYEVYATSVQQADSYLKTQGASWSVLEELAACEQDSRINEPEIAQPLCTVLQVALVDLISLWGIRPIVVVGHSSGEIGAAYAAGALSSKDAWKIAYHRGRAAKRLSVLYPDLRGGMTAVGISSEDMAIHLKLIEPDVKAIIACFNSPGNITLSGDIDALQVLEARLDAENIFNRRLKVTTAYHSYHMEYIAEEYKQSIIDIEPCSIRSGCAFFSSVTGAPVEGSQLNAEYWCSNMISPVRFSQAVQAIVTDRTSKASPRKKTARIIDTFVEIGPSGALQSPLRQILSSMNCLENKTIFSMLSRGQDAIETSLNLMSRLWTLGYPDLNLDGINSYKAQAPSRQVLVDTPLYPWDHSTRYWHEDRISVKHRHPNAPRLDLLGFPVEDWNPAQPSWRHRLKVGELPWIKEHKVQGSIIFPAAGYICAVIEAARQIADRGKAVKCFELRDVVFGRALDFTSETDVIELITSLKPRKLGLRAKEAPWIECTLYSNGLEEYLEHCSALLQIHYEQEVSQFEGSHEGQIRKERTAQEYHAVLSKSTKEIRPSELYATLEGVGLQYGPLFQGMSSIRSGLAGCGCTTITVSNTREAMPAKFEFDHLIHPCTLDACFQSVFVAFAEQSEQKLQAMVPTAIDLIRVSANQPRGAGAKYYGFSKGTKRGFRDAVGSIYMSDHAWSAPLLEIEGFCCTELGSLFGGMAPEQAAMSVRKMQSYWRWEADPALLTPQMACKLIQMSENDFKANREIYASTTIDGEKLSAIFGKSALGWLSQEAEAKLPAHLISYVGWLQQQYRLAREGALALQHGSKDWVTMSPDDEQAFIAEKEFTSIDATLLTAIGRELTNILEGHVSPLSVLMKDNMLFDFYANPVTAAQWEKLFTLFGHKQPDMKILEIGAGTGSSAEPILRALAAPDGSTTRCSNYVFTDISPGFFEPAEKKLKQWSNVITYKRLDIEMDPLDQGFEAESFDIIIATNVLHATKNIDDTLQNVLRLLKSGGHLIVGEITSPKARLTMIYGTLPGWWLSEDGRQGGPCMTEKQWIDAFSRNGLHLDYTVWDVPEEMIHLMSLFSTTKKTQRQLPFEKVMIVDNGSPSLELRHLADKLRESLVKWGVQSERYNIDDVNLPDSATSNKLVKPPAWISLLEIEDPFLLKMDEVQFRKVQEFLLNTSATLWVTKGDRLNDCDPEFRLIDGLLRTIRNEVEGLRLHSLDFQKTLKLDCEVAPRAILSFFQSLFGVDQAIVETETAFHDGKFMIPRLYDDQHKNYDLQMLHKQRLPTMQPVKQVGRPLRLTIGTPGILDTLHFTDDGDAYEELPEEYVEFEVKAVALNFMDIMVSMGIVPDDIIGCDAAGIVTRIGSRVSNLKPGDRVVCIALGAYRNLIRTPGSLLQKIPSQMSFEDAATLPTIYVTAYQSLVEIGRLQAGETVLIHAAAGGLGQAAIQLAKHLGADIYVTVGSLEKKKLIVNAYGIPEDHIFNSRDLTFADAIMRATNGKGVDVVINSLAGEALRKTWTCIRSFGRFIEVGKKDILGNTGLEMMPFLRNVLFAAVNVEHMTRHHHQVTARLTAKVFDLVRAGHVTPVQPITVYSISNIEKAFRTMQQGKHTGKLVLSMENGDAEVPVIPNDLHPLQLRDDRTYLLVGGLGGLGRAQAKWFASNGARYLAFISRSGAMSSAAKETLRMLEHMSVCAKVYACDISDRDALAVTLTTMHAEMPQVSGVIQGAMVLADSFFSNMSFDSWANALRPKVSGSWNLHELLPRELDFFIMLSSIAGISGSRGQSNYAAGNTFQGALAWHRNALGLPATVLDLGIMVGFGFVEENRSDVAINNLLQQMRPIAIQPDEFFSVLKSSITGFTDGDNRMPVQASLGVATGGMVRTFKLNEDYDFYWTSDTKFAFLRCVDALGVKLSAEEGDSAFKATLAAASTFTDAVDIVQGALIQKLAKAMMISLDDVDMTKPISTYGVDSLLAVEVRNWIAREMRSELSVFDLLSSIPMSQLVRKVTSKSLLVRNEVKAEANDETAEVVPGEVSGTNAST